MAVSSRPVRPELPATWQDTALTEEEVSAAVEAFREAKWHRIKASQYAYDLAYPPPVPVISQQQLSQIKRAEAAKLGLVIDAENEELFEMLCSYFSNEAPDYFSHGTPDAPHGGRDPEKGLLLAGPIGCGKTTLLRLFMQNPRQRYGLVSCRTVAGRYQSEGASGLEPYQERHHTGGVVFDDLGTEPMPVKFYGTDCNTMADVLLARYDEFQAGRLPGCYTHMTTNLPVGTPDDAPGTLTLYGLYGARVVDRIKQMFTLVKFPASAPSRRK